MEKMQECIWRRTNMGKCAKMMKMSWQNTVPKCAKVTIANKTKHRLPYLKIIFQRFMGPRILFSIMATEADKIGFFYPTINPTVNVLPAIYTT
jgi:hypothetical protein